MAWAFKELGEVSLCREYGTSIAFRDCAAQSWLSFELASELVRRCLCFAATMRPASSLELQWTRGQQSTRGTTAARRGPRSIAGTAGRGRAAALAAGLTIAEGSSSTLDAHDQTPELPPFPVTACLRPTCPVVATDVSTNLYEGHQLQLQIQ